MQTMPIDQIDDLEWQMDVILCRLEMHKNHFGPAEDPADIQRIASELATLFMIRDSLRQKVCKEVTHGDI